jgi:hypothetical protein
MREWSIARKRRDEKDSEAVYNLVTMLLGDETGGGEKRRRKMNICDERI